MLAVRWNKIIFKFTEFCIKDFPVLTQQLCYGIRTPWTHILSLVLFKETLIYKQNKCRTSYYVSHAGGRNSHHYFVVIYPPSNVKIHS